MAETDTSITDLHELLRMKKKPQPIAKQRSEPPQEITMRQLWWRLGTGAAVALTLAVVLVFGMNRPRSLTDEERGVLRAYEEVRGALADDDLESAKAAAERMAKDFSDRAPTAAPARKVAGSATLREARLAFKDLSTDALRLARAQTGYHIARCPGAECMAKCNGCPMSEFSAWVQVSTEIGNPFMGRAHPDCGIITQ